MHRLFDPLLAEAATRGAGLDWKTSLQELGAARGLGPPSYRVQDDGPDHATIGCWVADGARKAKPVLEALDAACAPQAQTLALDEIFFGGDRPWSASSRPA